MILLLLVFLTVVPGLLGCLVRKLMGDRRRHGGETYLLGVFALFFLWECFSLAMVELGLSFHFVVRVFSGALLLLVTLAILLCGRQLWGMPGEWRLPEWATLRSDLWAWLVALALFLVQVLAYVFLRIDRTADVSVENVQTILYTDQVYRFHPGTGAELVIPVSRRGRVQSLVPFYAYLCVIGDAAPADVVCRLAPIWGLTMCYLAYGLLLGAVLGRMREHRLQYAVCYMVLGMLFLTGALSGRGLYYEQLHRGYRGETWVYNILLPYVLYLLMQIYHKHKEGVAPRVRALVCLVAAIGLSATWADLWDGTMQLLLAVAICSAIALATLLHGLVQQRRLGGWRH